MLRTSLLVSSALAASVGAALCGCADRAVPNAADAAPAPYASSCATCHGETGEGVAGLGLELRHSPPTYFNWVVRNGRVNTTMLAFPSTSVSDAQLGEIQSWLNAMPRPTSGQALYVDFCGNCHGPAGRGGTLLASSITGKVRADLTMLVRAGEGTDPSMRFSYMPAEDATQLSDAELDLIATFLGAL